MLLGIDIGGTKTAFALADRQGRLVARSRQSTAPSGRPREDVARMLEEVRRLLSEAGIGTSALLAAGASVPGPLDSRRGVLMHPPNLEGWREVPLGEWLADELGCPVRLENDANASALAEWRFGAGQGWSDIVYLTMSTGVGAGLILGGALYRGRDGTAGELGHVPLEWQGDPCSCGLRGCLEAYVGGASWARRLRSSAPRACRALALAGSREALRPEHVVMAAREGDPHALSEMARFNAYLARAIVQICFSLAPEAVVLGTIAVAAGDELCFEPLRALVAQHTWPHQAPYMRILPAGLGDELPYRAGVCVALESLES